MINRTSPKLGTCSLKDTVGRMKRQATNRLRENTFQIINFIKDFYPGFIKRCHNSTSRKINNPIKKIDKGFKQNILPKKIYKWKIST